MKSAILRITLIFLCAHSMAQASLDELLGLYNTRSIPYISVEELRMHQSHSELYILDAREYDEYEVSKIPSSSYAGYKDFSVEEISGSIPDKNSLIVVYCSLGIRSEQIAEKLNTAGYSNVRNLYGGIFEWKNKGYSVVDASGNETENVHAFSKIWSKWLVNANKIY